MSFSHARPLTWLQGVFCTTYMDVVQQAVLSHINRPRSSGHTADAETIERLQEIFFTTNANTGAGSGCACPCLGLDLNAGMCELIDLVQLIADAPETCAPGCHTPFYFMCPACRAAGGIKAFIVRGQVAASVPAVPDGAVSGAASDTQAGAASDTQAAAVTVRSGSCCRLCAVARIYDVLQEGSVHADLSPVFRHMELRCVKIRASVEIKKRKVEAAFAVVDRIANAAMAAAVTGAGNRGDDGTAALEDPRGASGM